ncbi:MAG: anthranilate phosphoribosyltransferase [Nitrososphaerota archaeon]|jgi:anthranilate phosphoribosyltransferase|uniref:anthranilate phosphoribosyltransferase n=1 Tax=Candidatus Bathycorpusculum sp. TaxID=2994959 RepID=UPI00282A7D1D|nr:anthranilate phosphoribosyltransferase [Candidatus Termiticorpusculum sp.]MCL2257476.1 anthranilate phosphoribosyltransferase [Candidatus Termiticorpusculum sp.]MCL2292389.1 anthranilate phosphoribosyltransferase [Candidatus Termiticorpusculum sp.]MDR0461232.1 anthranilate phosphoribosyltransferase [Nitrososphaerota archaeon]
MVTEEKLRTFGQLICKVATGKTMTREETCEAYKQIILNEQPELQQGAFLLAHITRKPTTEELSGVWDALDRFDTEKFKAKIRDGKAVCDIVGTGSDAMKTVNASSPAALIASACGAVIAKKGAKKVTGVSGASEIFEILGVNLSSPMSKAKQSLEKHNICYMPGEAFLKSGWARLIQYMRFTSTFNIVGPLTLPCENTCCIVIGAYAPEVCDQLVAILKEIGIKRAVAPYGMVKGVENSKGIDEFSPCGPTRVTELKNGKIQTYIVQPEDFGIKTHSTFDIASLNKAYDNAMAIKRVLSKDYNDPLADLFCMNAASALYVSGISDSYKDGMEKAQEALKAGKALKQLDYLVNQQA